MQSTINVLGVAGSMRADSYSTKALHIALELAKKYRAEVHLLDLGKTVLSLRDPSVPVSERVEAVARTVVEADAFILASPDYHGSMSGTLKNFLDHFYKEFGGKLFACIVASHAKRANRYGPDAHRYASVLSMEHALRCVCKWRAGFCKRPTCKRRGVHAFRDDGPRSCGIWQTDKRTVY
jgi:multimeric flavodoxin WrbA